MKTNIGEAFALVTGQKPVEYVWPGMEWMYGSPEEVTPPDEVLPQTIKPQHIAGIDAEEIDQQSFRDFMKGL